MPTRLLLFLCLFGHALGKKPPDVDCLVVHREYVSCVWNNSGPAAVNYTFLSKFSGEKEKHVCTTYLSENNLNTGCLRPYVVPQRFHTFTTELLHGKDNFTKDHDLKKKVLLNPPTNMTVLNGSDNNLWFYWNQTLHCVESQVRYRTNNNNWRSHSLSSGINSYCINLPSSNKQYELQVRSRVENSCGESLFWSNWSEPVIWGSNNSTALSQASSQTSVWTIVLYVVGGTTLILVVVMSLQHERFRVILIPVVPKPSLISHDIEDWFQLSKGLKDSFKPTYNELPCPVREYCHVSETDSESSDSSTCSVTTDQTDCSASIPVNAPQGPSTPLCSSASTVTCEEEEKEKLQESV